MAMSATGLTGDIGLLLWVCCSSWYYGYHISELNFPQPSLTCQTPSHSTISNDYLSSSIFPDCLHLTSNLYSTATAIFTLGGLFGSLISAKLIQYCKKSFSDDETGETEGDGEALVIRLSGWINLAASVLMALSMHWSMLLLGRVLAGITAGLAITTVPPLLHSISRTSSVTLIRSHSGSIGILNQLAIVIGIAAAQLVGLSATGVNGDSPGGWRWAVAGSGVVSAFQIVGGVALGKSVMSERTKKAESWNEEEYEDGEEGFESEGRPLDEDTRLLPDSDSSSINSISKSNHGHPSLTIAQLFNSPSLRPTTLLIAFVLASQQLAGINAVLFYSTPVLQSLLPGVAGLISIGISVVNALMTFPPLFLVDRFGRKPLLLLSLSGMAIMTVLLAVGLDHHIQVLSGVSIILFVAWFSIGLGAVPFLLIPELMPPHAVSAASSIGLSLSWISNFIVALVFLPLKNALTKNTDHGLEGEGRVFYVFLGVQVVSIIVIHRFLYK